MQATASEGMVTDTSVDYQSLDVAKKRLTPTILANA
jgi:hypothetical protein